MEKANYSSSFGLSALFSCLLVFCCLIQFAQADELSIGVSTCTRLDSEGQPQQFFCPNSLEISKHYCCGVTNFQYCCDYDQHEAFSAAAVAAMIIGPILVFLCVLGTVCWCCSCCCFANRRPQHIILTQPMSTTTIHQPMFVPQGYRPLDSAQNPHSSNQGFGPTQASMGKPPAYSR